MVAWPEGEAPINIGRVWMRSRKCSEMGGRLGGVAGEKMEGGMGSDGVLVVFPNDRGFTRLRFLVFSLRLKTACRMWLQRRVTVCVNLLPQLSILNIA